MARKRHCIRRKGFFRFLSSPAAIAANTQPPPARPPPTAAPHPPESTATIQHLEKTTKHLEKITKHLEKTIRHLVSHPPTRGETGRAPQTENHADRDQPTFSTKNPAPSLSYLFLSFFIEEKSYHNNNDRRWKRWKTGKRANARRLSAKNRFSLRSRQVGYARSTENGGKRWGKSVGKRWSTVENLPRRTALPLQKFSTSFPRVFHSVFHQTNSPKKDSYA